MRTFFSTVGLLLGLLVYAGCENVVEPAADTINWTEIQETPEYKQLEAIRADVFNQLMIRKVSKEAFERAYTSNDVNVVAAILDRTPEELARMVELFHRSIAYFQNEHPEINLDNESLEGKCTPADVESILANYDDLVANYASYEANMALKTSAGPSCRLVPYTACLVAAGYVAAAVSPTGIGSIIVLGAGAILCVCEYCSGGFLNWIC